MKTTINNRDLKFFLIGILTIIIIDLVWDWKNNLNNFKEGYNDVQKTNVIK